MPESLTLQELHAVLQTAMGWENYHLHQFEVDGVLYGDAEEVEGDEETFTLAQVAKAVGGFGYEYDFGDGWQHDIVIEQSMPGVGAGAPRLVDGAGAGPPEDCGGPGGFARLLEVLADPTSEEHAELLTWLGGSYDPGAFDLDALNDALDLFDRHTRQRRMRR